MTIGNTGGAPRCQSGRMAHDSPRDRILLAAIRAIEHGGLDALTVRGVARAAQVNVAAISYYFGGKDRLAATALAATLDQAFVHPLHDFDAARDAGISTEAAFFHLVDFLVAGAMRYPGLSRAHLAPQRLARGDDPLAERLSGFQDALLARLPDRSVTQEQLGQLLHAVVLTAVAPGLTQPLTGLDLSVPEQRERWVRCLIQAHTPNLVDPTA